MTANLKRWMLLGGALAMTLLLVWNSPEKDESAGVVQPRRSVAAAAPAAASAAPEATSTQFTLAARPPAAEQYVDLFAPRVIKVVPPPAPPVVPVKPMPPPLPFTVVGQMVENGHPKVFLQEGETLYAVVEGDTFGRSYKVLGIENGRINLLYLPLNMTQTISVGNRLE